MILTRNTQIDFSIVHVMVFDRGSEWRARAQRNRPAQAFERVVSFQWSMKLGKQSDVLKNVRLVSSYFVNSSFSKTVLNKTTISKSKVNRLLLLRQNFDFK